MTNIIDDDPMTFDDIIKELNVAIKQDGHDIYFKADSAIKLKNLLIAARTNSFKFDKEKP